MKTLTERWKEYRARAYKDGLGVAQHEQLQTAFFVGALSVLEALGEMQRQPLHLGVKQMMAIEDEAYDFAKNKIACLKARN